MSPKQPVPTPVVKAKDATVLTVPEAVRHFKKRGGDKATPWFVGCLMRNGQLARIKIGKKYFVSAGDIDRWITEHLVRS